MTSPANHDTIEQVREILRAQFPLARKKDFDKILHFLLIFVPFYFYR